MQHMCKSIFSRNGKKEICQESILVNLISVIIYLLITGGNDEFFWLSALTPWLFQVD